MKIICLNLIVLFFMLISKAYSQSPENISEPASYLLKFFNKNAVVNSGEKIIELPNPQGPYLVGTVAYNWLDTNRDEIITPEDNDYRQVTVQLYYPAKQIKDTRPAHYFPQIEWVRAGFRTQKGDFPQKLAQDFGRYNRVLSYSLPEALVDDTQDNYPLLLFGTGGNMSRHFYTGISEELASQGYIVAVISHPYSSMDFFPAGGFLMSSQHWQAPEDATQKEETKLDEELSNYLAADARFVLDQITMLHKNDVTGRFINRINLDKIAILGHSRAGKTVSRTSSTDDRIKAAVIYDNIGPDAERENGLVQPMMSMHRSWPESSVKALHGYLEKTGSYAYEVVIHSASHFTFSDMPIVDPDNYKVEGDPLQSFRVVMQYTLDFLNHTLKGDNAGLLESKEKVNGVQIKKFNTLK